MIVKRVEKHIVKPNHPYFSMIDAFCFQSKNLYNHANFLVRKEFVEKNKWLRYTDLDKRLKADKEYDDYGQMPVAQAAQQTLRLLDKNWNSFFKAMKDWKKNKDKYQGRPNLPKYKAKNGRFELILTNQNVKLKNGMLHFPKVFQGFTIKPCFTEYENFISFQQVRIVPNGKQYTIELVYNIDIPDKKLIDNKKYISIDIGLDNLATITNNMGLQPVIVNGKGLKSMNQYYNKQISHYRELAKRMNQSDYTKKMDKLTRKRNNKLDDCLHKISRFMIRYAMEKGANTIVIGNNKNWKQKSQMSKKVNQNFVGIPHKKLLDRIAYKAEEYGINVIITEESYTSGTSFLDMEEPKKCNYNKTRRIHRGLFVSNNGTKINADVNGSYQIMRKVFPNAFADGIEGVVLHPVRVSVC